MINMVIKLKFRMTQAVTVYLKLTCFIFKAAEI